MLVWGPPVATGWFMGPPGNCAGLVPPVGTGAGLLWCPPVATGAGLLWRRSSCWGEKMWDDPIQCESS